MSTAKFNAAILASVIVAGLGLGPAAAQEPSAGSAEAGQTYARNVCAECHSVEPGAKSSPEIKAPAFAVIAKGKLPTPAEIDGWLVSSHANMPDMAVPRERRADLIGYIRSLAVKP